MDIYDFEDLNETDNPDPIQARIEQQFDDYINSLSPKKFKEQYRFQKIIFLRLCYNLDLPKKARRRAYSPKFDVLMLLEYLANQSFIRIAGALLNLSKSFAHRAIHSVIDKLALLRDSCIYFPDNLNELKRKFQQKAELPGFIGAIDCTHIKIQSPGRATGERFRNRKGFFSINVQAVCDSELRFLDVVVQWPGRVHEIKILPKNIIKNQI